VPREIDHAELLDAAQRERAEQRLLWLRDPARPQQPGAAYTRLFSPEGWESLEQAIRDRRYSAAELTKLPDLIADLARERARLTGRGWLGAFLHQPLAIGSTQRVPASALSPLFEPVQTGHSPSGPSEALRAFGAVLEPHVRRFIELREQAEHEAQTRRDALARLMPKPKPADGMGAPQVLLAPARASTELAAAPTSAELARSWLERTDDAWRELSRWLIKHSELPSTEKDLARIFVGLRAFSLDGLARPDRRFYRLAVGARKLGFERDMTSRMRGENAPALLLPHPVVVALSVPSDVRVMQPDLEYGVLSDLSIAQGIGEGLALALTSPAVGALSARPQAASVSAAMGGLFAQLRADAAYLRRVDGFERDAAEQAARAAALWLLVRARLNAALALFWSSSARSSEERIQQLSAAGERAFGLPVPLGILAVTMLAEDSSEQQFVALHWGFELHALLRDRLDHDFYLNPKLSEVLRGAAARGAALDAPELAAELGGRGTAALDRLFELLG
jgi:hypothetical protein